MEPFPWQRRLCAEIPARYRPLVEVLEDRLLLTATLVGPVALSAGTWRNLTFQISDQPVAISGTVTSQSMEDSALIGLPQVMADYPYRGTGYTVAVIDTGIDYNNPYLGGGWGNRVIGGWNFVANNDNPMDDNGHGTSVAGIIGGSDPSDLGIAPNVDFVALKCLTPPARAPSATSIWPCNGSPLMRPSTTSWL